MKYKVIIETNCEKDGGIHCPNDAFDVLRKYIENGSRKFYLMILDDSYFIIKLHVIDINKYDPPNQNTIFSPALLTTASYIIIAHNLSMDSLEPTISDIETFEHLKEFGEKRGIKLLDNLIIAGGGYYSIADSKGIVFNNDRRNHENIRYNNE